MMTISVSHTMYTGVILIEVCITFWARSSKKGTESARGDVCKPNSWNSMEIIKIRCSYFLWYVFRTNIKSEISLSETIMKKVSSCFVKAYASLKETGGSDRFYNINVLPSRFRMAKKSRYMKSNCHTYLLGQWGRREFRNLDTLQFMHLNRKFISIASLGV